MIDRNGIGIGPTLKSHVEYSPIFSVHTSVPFLNILI